MAVEDYKERAKHLRQDDDGMLQAMCQFLALSEDEKLAFLPPIRNDVAYQINDCGDRTSNPLYSYCNAIFELTDRFHGPREGGFAELIADINSLVAIIIEQQKQYPFIWYIDKTAHPVCGPADRVWNVLRRLAEHALAIRQWPKGPPAIPFAETTWAGTRGPTL
jgi:hypothetical protein